MLGLRLDVGGVLFGQVLDSVRGLTFFYCVFRVFVLSFLLAGLGQVSNSLPFASRIGRTFYGQKACQERK